MKYIFSTLLSYSVTHILLTAVRIVSDFRWNILEKVVR